MCIRDRAEAVPLPLAGYVLDAGCGLGHGLQALERAYPEVHLHGLENSWPLRWAAAVYARHAHVHHGDMWAHDWSRYDMVYLFQRPESMVRAWDKASRDMKPGSWLASLEFPVPDAVSYTHLDVYKRQPADRTQGRYPVALESAGALG